MMVPLNKLDNVWNELNAIDAALSRGADIKEIRRRLRDTAASIARLKRDGFSSVSTLGGIARAKKLSARKRSEIAKKAVAAREAKRKAKKGGKQ